MNLSRACALSCLMLGSPYPPGALEALAACARYLCGPAFTSDLAARARVAGELGVPVSAVNAAAAWEFGMGAGSETPVEGRTPLGGGYS